MFAEVFLLFLLRSVLVGFVWFFLIEEFGLLHKARWDETSRTSSSVPALILHQQQKLGRHLPHGQPAPLKIQNTLHKATTSGANPVGFLQLALGLGFSGASLAHVLRPVEEKALLFPAEQQTHGCAVPRQKPVLSVHPRDEKLSSRDLLCFALPPSLL